MQPSRRLRLLSFVTVAWLVSAPFVYAQQRELTPRADKSFLPSPSIDEFLSRCPTIEEIAAVNQNFALVFDADPTQSEPLACTEEGLSLNLTRFQKRVYQSLIAMQKIQFDRPLPWTTLTLSEWFRHTVGGIHFRSDVSLSSCCEPGGLITVKTAATRAEDNSCLMGGVDPDPKIFINSQTGCGMESFIALLAHEARHREGFGHTCDGGVNDNTITEMGAWAVEYYTYLYLADHTGNYLRPIDGRPPTTYGDYLRGDAQSICSTRFCQVGCPLSIKLNEALLGSLFITLEGSVSIDSFNSFNGPWGSRCSECPGGINTAGAGDVQSGGAVSLGRAVEVRGTVQADSRSDTQAVRLPPDARDLGDFTLGRDQSLVLPEGDYVADTFNMTGAARLTTRGAVRIWVRQSVSLGGSAVLESDSESARDLWLIAAPGMRRADLDGHVRFTGVLYAPDTPINVFGNCDISGALLGTGIVMSGATRLHFDEYLRAGSLMEPLPMPPRSR